MWYEQSTSQFGLISLLSISKSRRQFLPIGSASRYLPIVKLSIFRDVKIMGWYTAFGINAMYFVFSASSASNG